MTILGQCSKVPVEVRKPFHSENHSSCGGCSLGLLLQLAGVTVQPVSQRGGSNERGLCRVRKGQCLRPVLYGKRIRWPGENVLGPTKRKEERRVCRGGGCGIASQGFFSEGAENLHTRISRSECFRVDRGAPRWSKPWIISYSIISISVQTSI